MHDQHDDPLERELSRLSQYTGEPTTIWQDAVEQHRREQQQKVWVWVRRPAPALAAACLALMVAAVSFRPLAPVSLESAAGTGAARTLGAEDRDAAGSGSPLAVRSAPGAFTRDQLNADINQKAKGLEGSVVRSNDRQDVPIAPHTGDAAAGGAEGERLLTAAPNPPPAATGAPVESGSNLASRGGVNAPGRAAPANRSPGAGADQPRYAGARPEGGLHEEKLATTGGTDNHNAGNADAPADNAPVNDPLEQTATLRLAVADVNRFYYKQVPELLDAKNGESITNEPLPSGNENDASGGVNLTIRVPEERIPQLIEELRKSGVVQSETTRLNSKEDRLKQIDSLVSQNEVYLRNTAVAPKSKAAAPAAPLGTPADKETAAKSAPAEEAARTKAHEAIIALNRRRAAIEQGRELATLNVIAVPELQPPPAAAKPAAPVLTPGVPTPSNPLADAPQTTPPIGGEPGRLVTVANTGKDESTKENHLTPAAPVPGPTEKFNRTLDDPAPHTPPAAAPDIGGPGGASMPPTELGDSTSIPHAGTSSSLIYWVLIAAAALAGLWWFRRRAAAASLREPPPN